MSDTSAQIEGPARVAAFWVSGVLIGLPINRVDEVIAEHPMVAVPAAPPGVVGLVNLRGRVLAVTDARARMGLPERGGDDPSASVIVATGTRRDCLLLDRPEDVLEVPAESWAEVPVTLGEPLRSWTTAVAEVEAGLLLLLDIDRVLADPATKGASHAGDGR